MNGAAALCRQESLRAFLSLLTESLEIVRQNVVVDPMSSPQPDLSARYRIGMVARLVGLTTHTVRMWERRYGAVEPTRSEGGGRLYSDQDVARLRKLQRLVDAGHSIGQVATLPDGELSQLLVPRPLEGDEGSSNLSEADIAEACASFLAAISDGEVRRAQEVLDRAAGGLAIRRFVQEVALPVLHEIGRRWAVGEMRIAQEHAASQLFRNLLGRLGATAGTDDGAPVALSCSPAGQQHQLGAMMAGLIASSHGYRVVHLGADVPAEEIVYGASMTGAELILLSITIDDAASVEQLEILARELPDQVRLVIGGRGAPRGRAGSELISDFEALSAELQRDLRS